LKYLVRSNKNSLIEKSQNSNKRTLDSNIICNSHISNEIDINKKKKKTMNNLITNSLVKTKKKKIVLQKMKKSISQNNKNLKFYFVKPLQNCLESFFSESKKGKKVKLDYLEELRLEHFKNTFKKFKLFENLLKENPFNLKLEEIDIFEYQHKILKTKYLFLDMDETLIYCSTKCSNREAIPIKTSLTPQTVF
jgi:hypothetical protein